MAKTIRKTQRKRKKASRKTRKKTARKKPGLDRCEAAIEISERADGATDNIRAAWKIEWKKAARTGARTRTGRKGGKVTESLARSLAAVGHLQRLRIMEKLIEGPATYKTLQKVTRLQAGPLYHHVQALRVAGLLLPKQRDLYALTRGGRNAILSLLAVAGLIRDGRRRP